MSKQNTNLGDGVFLARCLEDVREAECGVFAPFPSILLGFVGLAFYTFFANLLLKLVTLLWFPSSACSVEKVEKIVVYSRGTLGDNVVHVRCIRALRDLFPQAKLTILVNATGHGTVFAEKLFAGLSYIDQVCVFPDAPVNRIGWRIHYSDRIDRFTGCDVFLNLSAFGNTGWLGAVARELLLARRLKARHIIGFQISTWNRTGVGLNRARHRFLKNEPRRGFEALKGRFSSIGTVNANHAFPQNQRSINAIHDLLAKGRLKSGRILVCNPGAKFRIKCWPAERFAQSVSILAKEYGMDVVAVGTARELQLCELVKRLATVPVVNLAGCTEVWDLIELLRMAALCITNDTGTMHLSSGVDCPTVGIFATLWPPSMWYPTGEKVRALFAFNERTSFTQNADPDAAASECVLSVQVDDVVRASRELL